MSLSKKQQEFREAMQKYHSMARYQLTYKVVSFLNVTMQLFLVSTLFSFHLTALEHMLLFLVAYVVSDFINGGMHLYMDNSDDYKSLFGPFIASFHLHHKNPKYKDSNVVKLYYNESGVKFWLVPFQMLSIGLYFLGTNEIIITFLAYFSVLSSVAEVSHYLCHNSDSKFVLFLQKYHILLNKKHHDEHHQKDNKSYAFLNGMSDPLLNYIAKKYYHGYKKVSDLHYANYDGADTKNRT